MRRLPASYAPTEQMEANLEKLSQDEQLRGDLQQLLSELNKPEAHYLSTLFQEKHKKPPRWFYYTRILPFMNLLLLGLTFFNSQFLIPFIALTILNMTIHYWNKQNVTEYAATLPQLIRMNHMARKLLGKSDFGQDRGELQNAIRSLERVHSHMSIFRLEARL